MSNTKMISSRVHVKFLEEVRHFLSEYYKKELHIWDSDGSGLMSDYYVLQYATRFISQEIRNLGITDISDLSSIGSKILTTNQAAKLLNKSARRIRQMCKEQKLGYIQHSENADIFILRDSVEKLLRPKVERNED